MSDLKKEFLSFKRNVLVELERQREMIQKMIKEVFVTMEF